MTINLQLFSTNTILPGSHLERAVHETITLKNCVYLSTHVNFFVANMFQRCK